MFYLVLSLLGCLIFLYLKKCTNFWKNKGVPSTSPHLLFGDLKPRILGTRPATLVYEDIYKAFPEEPFVGFYEFLKPNLLIKDPQLIESILVKDFSHFTNRVHIKDEEKHHLTKSIFFMQSEHWKSVRGRMVTSFSASKMKNMFTLMNQCANDLDSILSEKCQDDAVNMKDIIARYSTDAIGYCAFGLNFNALNKPESEYLKFGQSIFENTMKNSILDILRNVAPESYLYYWTKFTDSPIKYIKFYHTVKQTAELRKAESNRRNDLLQLMLDFRDECQEKALKEKNYDGVIVDDIVVLATMILIFAATFESAPGVLSYCFYELAMQPEIQERLRNEVQSILKANNGELTYESLKQMKYAEMVICETLRKDNSIPLLRRACTSPYKLPGTDLILNVGQLVGISVHALHHDEKYYPNPDKFDPERFTPENIAARPAFTYLPFGDGPRMCIAMRFAKMTLKLLLARIISKYEMLPCSKTEVPVVHPRSVGSSPINPIQLRIQKL